jgi:hypothetical protein
MTFFEFFCGGGMARAGLGANWTSFQLAHHIGPVLEAHPSWGWRNAVEWMRANGGVPQITEAEIEAKAELLRGASRQ